MLKLVFTWFAVAALCAGCSVLNKPQEHDLCAEMGGVCDPRASCTPDGETIRCVCPAGYH